MKKSSSTTEQEPASYIYFDYNKMQYPFYNLDPLYVDLGNGTCFPVPAYEENFLIQHMNYGYNIDDVKKSIHIHLNHVYKEFPLHLQDAFIDNFMRMHQGHKVETAPPIPLYSVNNEYTYYVAGDIKENITIPAKLEKELVDIINAKGRNCKKDIEQRIYKYYDDRGIICLYPRLEYLAQDFISSKGVICERYKKDSNIGDNILGGLYVLLQLGVLVLGACIVIYFIYCMIFK